MDAGVRNRMLAPADLVAIVRIAVRRVDRALP
jgi:hypothetical protein